MCVIALYKLRFCFGMGVIDQAELVNNAIVGLGYWDFLFPALAAGGGLHEQDLFCRLPAGNHNAIGTGRGKVDRHFFRLRRSRKVGVGFCQPLVFI